MVSRNIVRLFESRKGRLEYRVNRDFIRNGIARIPCRISNYNDVISPYSVKGYDTLNPSFVEYVKSTADCTPPECPVVLNIIEDCLSPEERNTINVTIRDDFSYDLGMLEKTIKRHTRIFCFLFIGLLIAGILLWITRAMDEIPRELVFILFWFMGDTICDYIFLTGHDLRQEKRLAGRLASIKVIFSKTYEDPKYTKSDVSQLYSEIEQEVHETIQKKN